MKILIFVLLLVLLVFATDSTYYRKATMNEDNRILTTYVNKLKDTVTTVSGYGIMVPYSIIVKDGVIVTNENLSIVEKDSIGN